MNPLSWVRWKVVGVLAIVGLAFYFIGLDPIALSAFNGAGESAPAARWAVGDMALGLLGGNVALEDLLVATPRGKAESAAGKEAPAAAGPEEKVFNASSVKVDLSMLSLLRGRYVVDQVSLEAPKLHVTRRQDGTVNIEDLGGAPPEDVPQREGESRDWLETLKRWYEKIQKVREKLPERRKKEAEERTKAGPEVDYSRGVTYPFEGRPGAIIHEIVGTGFEVDFNEEGAGAKIPSLKNGEIKIREVTSNPSVQKEPTTFSITGQIAGAPVSIEGNLDFRGDRSDLGIEIQTGDLPVSLVEAFAGPSLPVSFKSGTIGLETSLSLKGADALDLRPKLAFKKIAMDAKDPGGKIAGLDAAKFVTAFNEASAEIDTLVIEDLKISGSLFSPRFEWGDTVKNLVISGGKAFAQKQAQAQLEKGQKLLDEQLQRLPVPDAAKGITDKLKGAVKDAEVKDLKKGLQSIFGGAPAKPAEDKPAEEKK